MPVSESPSKSREDQPRSEHLIKSIRWWDGFIFGLAVPGFLLPSLGSSITDLGAVAAAIIWAASAMLGALQNNIYAELATAMPGKSGGIGIYANEAFKRYTKVAGPIIVWGYWFAWSSVLSINGLLVGGFLTSEFWPTHKGGFLVQVVGTIMLVCLWLLNLYGLRPGVWLSYALATFTTIPLVIVMFAPIVNRSFDIHKLLPAALPGNIHWLSWAGISLLGYWFYTAGWSAYGFECVATFAPEYKNTLADTPRALRSSAVFSVLAYGLVPIAIVGVLGQEKVRENVYTALAPALRVILPGSLGTVTIGLVIASLVLSANVATLDGSRSLWQMSKDKMTITQFGRLNRYGVPHVGMTLDLLVQITLMWVFPESPISILVASNLGYILCHIFALMAFVLLRRDQPGIPRPLRLSSVWIPIAYGLAFINALFIMIGSWKYGLKALGIGIFILLSGLLLYLFRIIIQERTHDVKNYSQSGPVSS